MIGLKKVKTRIPHVVVIFGNHDWYDIHLRVQNKEVEPKVALSAQFLRDKLPNCHVLCHEQIEILGLNIFGCGWIGYHSGGSPDEPGNYPVQRLLFDTAKKVPHRWGEVPKGVDILLTHCPALEILDCVGQGTVWGSSSELKKAIYRTRPRVHLFGHLHEQRGVWRKGEDGVYTGGVEYQVNGSAFETIGPPPPDYPCELISNNAMENHYGLERTKKHFLAGSPRLIIADRTEEGGWKFST